MRTRLALILIFLLALILPWAGWQLVQQMEALLREGQEQAQRSATDALARVVANVAQLPAPGSALYVHRTQVPPVLDGGGDDWEAYPGVAAANGRLTVHLVEDSHALYAMIEVRDSSRVWADVTQPFGPIGDSLDIRLSDATGTQRWKIGNAAPGKLDVLADIAENPPPVGDWMEMSGGYRVEVRLPRPQGAARLAIAALDVGLKNAPSQRIALTEEGEDPPALMQHDATLDQMLARMAPPGARLRLLSNDAFVLGQAGSLDLPEPQRGGEAQPTAWKARLYRLLFAPPSDVGDSYAPNHSRLDVPIVWQALSGISASSVRASSRVSSVIVAAAAPLRRNDQVVGALILEQPSAALLVLADRAVFGVMAASLFVVVLTIFVIVGYTGVLRLRIRRLRDAAERALRPDGRLEPRLPHLAAADDVGDLSRSFARLLGEVGGHNEYLKTLSSKLSHELNTPLAIVRSSLDNLEHVTLSADARTYAERARAGAERLSGILRTMSEANRVERAIASAEGEDFNLADLVRGCAEAYRDLLAPRRIDLTVPAVPLIFHGAPDLIAQALDKLIDNARSFTPSDGWVRIVLEEEAGTVYLGVANRGPLLPPKLGQRLFDSLVSARPESTGVSSEAPHLGLGLFIVRLVAELHGGSPEAHNLEDGSGVEFRLTLRGMARQRM